MTKRRPKLQLSQDLELPAAGRGELAVADTLMD